MAETEQRMKPTADQLEMRLADRLSWRLHPRPSDLSMESAGDQRAIVQRRLDHPIDFPAIRAALVPDDRVALVVDPSVPEAVDIVSAAATYFHEAGAGKVDVVLEQCSPDDLLMDLASELSGTAKVVRHDDSRREALRYLMADATGEALYVNREILDADFVLPITAPSRRDADTRSTFPAHASVIYPVFADGESRRRFETCKREADDEVGGVGFAQELTWALGVQTRMVVWPDSNARVADISVQKIDTPLGANTHEPVPAIGVSQSGSPARVELVVAVVDGGVHHQTWDNVIRAAVAAADRLESSGTLVLWTSLDLTPGESLQNELSGTHASDDAADQRRGKDDGDEPEFATWDEGRFQGEVWRDLSERFRIMIHCRLSPDVIEELDFGVVETVDELDRLIRAAASCGIIRAAQFMSPGVAPIT